MVTMSSGGSKMPVVHLQYPRIDTIDLKLQIEKKLGRTRLNQYLNLLKSYLSLKVTKSDFDNLCIHLLGRDNLSLHNKLIQSIIKNACVSKYPLRNHEKGKPSSNIKIPNGSQQSCLQDVLPKSPRKHRTLVLRDRRSKDRFNPLGPYVKPQINVTCEGVITPKLQEQQSATELLSLGSKPPVEVNSVEEGEEVDQHGLSPGIHSRSPLVAPIGVSFAAKGTKKFLCHRSSTFLDVETCYNNRELPGSSFLKERLDQTLSIEGLKASDDFVNLLNIGLDVFVKRVLKPCVDLSASRSKLNLSKNVQFQGTSVRNGMRNRMQNPTSMPFSVSMTDFRVAMESNPRVLGEDWPVQLEKVCFRASEE